MEAGRGNQCRLCFVDRAWEFTVYNPDQWQWGGRGGPRRLPLLLLLLAVAWLCASSLGAAVDSVPDTGVAIISNQGGSLGGLEQTLAHFLFVEPAACDDLE